MAAKKQPLDVSDEPTDSEQEVDDQAIKSRAKQPKPGDADYDWSQHYDTEDLFRYTFDNGTVVVIRGFNSIYSKTFMYRLRKSRDDVDVMFPAIDRASCDVAQSVLESLDAPLDSDPIEDLWLAWVASGTGEDEGLKPGE